MESRRKITVYYISLLLCPWTKELVSTAECEYCKHGEEVDSKYVECIYEEEKDDGA